MPTHSIASTLSLRPSSGTGPFRTDGITARIPLADRGRVTSVGSLLDVFPGAAGVVASDRMSLLHSPNVTMATVPGAIWTGGSGHADPVESVGPGPVRASDGTHLISIRSRKRCRDPVGPRRPMRMANCRRIPRDGNHDVRPMKKRTMLTGLADALGMPCVPSAPDGPAASSSSS